MFDKLLDLRNGNSLMKKILMLAAILGLFLSADSGARTWKSADGKKTFEGTLRSFDKNSGIVKVVSSKGQLLSFNQKVLSSEDREFLLSESKTPADSTDSSAELDSSKVGKQIDGTKLKLMDGKRFKSAKLETTPEYYILYFSASW